MVHWVIAYYFRCICEHFKGYLNFIFISLHMDYCRFSQLNILVLTQAYDHRIIKPEDFQGVLINHIIVNYMECVHNKIFTLQNFPFRRIGLQQLEQVTYQEIQFILGQQSKCLKCPCHWPLHFQPSLQHFIHMFFI